MCKKFYLKLRIQWKIKTEMDPVFLGVSVPLNKGSILITTTLVRVIKSMIEER